MRVPGAFSFLNLKTHKKYRAYSDHDEGTDLLPVQLDYPFESTRPTRYTTNVTEYASAVMYVI